MALQHVYLFWFVCFGGGLFVWVLFLLVACFLMESMVTCQMFCKNTEKKTSLLLTVVIYLGHFRTLLAQLDFFPAVNSPYHVYFKKAR